MKKKDRYLNSLPPQGEAGGRERPNEDETGVTSRGPYEKKKSLSKTYRRHSRWNEAGASFNTDPSTDERQMHFNTVKCRN
ncbi:hypothetical protein TNCV_1692731 [Trichonephila clavipes]|nr:hypothetical protein TNCV_1692731 [Trichonephila clavipes]